MKQKVKIEIEVDVPDGKEVYFNDETLTLEYKDKPEKPRSWEDYFKTLSESQRISFEKLESDLYNLMGPIPDYYDLIAYHKLIMLRNMWWYGWKPDLEAYQWNKLPVDDPIYKAVEYGSIYFDGVIYRFNNSQFFTTFNIKNLRMSEKSRTFVSRNKK